MSTVRAYLKMELIFSSFINFARRSSRSIFSSFDDRASSLPDPAPPLPSASFSKASMGMEDVKSMKNHERK